MQTRLEDVLEDVLKTSWRRLGRRLEDVLKTFYEDVLQIRLEDVLKDKKCYAEDVFKTSWRRLGKQEMFAGMVESCFSFNAGNSNEA